MTPDRFVVFGLGTVRASWPIDLARWSQGGEVPIEFLPCISESEITVRISEGRACSLAMLDPGVPGVDRDLIRMLAEAGVRSVLVTGSPAQHLDSSAMGAASVVAPPSTVEEFQSLVRAHGRPIRSVGAAPAPEPRSAHGPAWQAPLIAVTGPPGSGRSTLAASLAQHFAGDARYSQDVVLADLARRAHQALLHDAGDVLPAFPDLVELHRARSLGHDDVRRHLYDVPSRGYQLLLGLRHPSDWTTLRHDALAAAIQSLRASTRSVIADVDAEVAGESDTGSFDIEDRNSVARTIMRVADVVVTIASGSLTGLHGLAHVLAEHRSFGIDPRRQIVAINRAPRSPKARAELTRTAHGVLLPHGGPPNHGLVFIPFRKDVERSHRDRTRMPDLLGRTLAAAVNRQLAERSDEPGPTESLIGVPVAAGSLGHLRPPGHR